MDAWNFSRLSFLCFHRPQSLLHFISMLLRVLYNVITNVGQKKKLFHIYQNVLIAYYFLYPK